MKWDPDSGVLLFVTSHHKMICLFFSLSLLSVGPRSRSSWPAISAWPSHFHHFHSTLFGELETTLSPGDCACSHKNNLKDASQFSCSDTTRKNIWSPIFASLCWRLLAVRSLLKYRCLCMNWTASGPLFNPPLLILEISSFFQGYSLFYPTPSTFFRHERCGNAPSINQSMKVPSIPPYRIFSCRVSKVVVYYTVTTPPLSLTRHDCHLAHTILMTMVY